MLWGLTNLSADAAKALAAIERWDGILDLTALDAPTSVEIATILAARKGPLRLPSLKRISPKTLSALIAKEDVYLPSVQTLELIPEPDGSPTEDFIIPPEFAERQRRQSTEVRVTIDVIAEPAADEPAAPVKETTKAIRQGIGPSYSEIDDVEKHLAECERLHGLRSPHTAAAMLLAAGSRFEAQGIAEADALFRRAVEVHDTACGKHSARTALCLLVDADALVKEDRLQEALPLLERAVEIHEDVSGPDHPETVLAVRSLADVEERLGRNETAWLMRNATTRPPSNIGHCSNRIPGVRN